MLCRGMKAFFSWRDSGFEAGELQPGYSPLHPKLGTSLEQLRGLPSHQFTAGTCRSGGPGLVFKGTRCRTSGSGC